MKLKWFSFICFILACITSPLSAAILRENLKRAQPGDYLVIASNKTNILMHIQDKQLPILTIEEIVAPNNVRKANWKEWISQNAPGHTSWVLYDIDVETGRIVRYYSFTKKNWFEIPDSDNLLSKLLNLNLQKIPDYARKKIGPKTREADFRPLWQPPLIVEGQIIKGVLFDAYRAHWPKDGSDLSGKTIEVYLPQENQRFPSYFPYWLQISGIAGKAKIRIIDSGSAMTSPKSFQIF